MSWREQGACWDTAISDFFPGYQGGHNSQQEAARAKAVCATCTVTVECLDYAVTNQMHWGIWGGLAERQRREVKKTRRGAA